MTNYEINVNLHEKISVSKEHAKELGISLESLAEEVARESGISVESLIGSSTRNSERIGNMRKSDSGKYTVIGVDKFDDSDWIEGAYDTAEEALRKARNETADSVDYADDQSIATVYYAYNPEGKYIGGDVWNGE